MNTEIITTILLFFIAAVYLPFQYVLAKPHLRPFLVPEEVPTIGSIVYSMLPPVKIGKDNRFGFGFRLGRNADLQFLVELGPQSHTVPLGPRSSKRHNQKLSSTELKDYRKQIMVNTKILSKEKRKKEEELLTQY